MSWSAKSRRQWIHAAVVILLAMPAILLAKRLALGELGANPVETLTHGTGETALRLLVATLAVTPIRRWFRWNAIAPYRRTLGLLAFSYAFLHFAIWVALDRAFAWQGMWADVLDRPFISAGFTAFVLLLPLAVTSTRGWIRRLGRRWTQLHRIVYAAAIAAVVHFLWLVKADLREPLIYAGLVALLLAARSQRIFNLGVRLWPRKS